MQCIVAPFTGQTAVWTADEELSDADAITVAVGSDVAERTLQEARVEDFLEVGDTARMPRLAVAAQVTRVQVRYVGLQFVVH